jgi:hypothetical protein
MMGRLLGVEFAGKPREKETLKRGLEGGDWKSVESLLAGRLPYCLSDSEGRERRQRRFLTRQTHTLPNPPKNGYIAPILPSSRVSEQPFMRHRLSDGLYDRKDGLFRRLLACHVNDRIPLPNSIQLSQHDT